MKAGLLIPGLLALVAVLLVLDL
ncbi:hypothetical protein LCGC14_3074310, partial [marine sediment metagenome]